MKQWRLTRIGACQSAFRPSAGDFLNISKCRVLALLMSLPSFLNSGGLSCCLHMPLDARLRSPRRDKKKASNGIIILPINREISHPY